MYFRKKNVIFVFDYSKIESRTNLWCLKAVKITNLMGVLIEFVFLQFCQLFIIKILKMLKLCTKTTWTILVSSVFSVVWYLTRWSHLKISTFHFILFITLFVTLYLMIRIIHKQASLTFYDSRSIFKFNHSKLNMNFSH